METMNNMSPALFERIMNMKPTVTYELPEKLRGVSIEPAGPGLVKLIYRQGHACEFITLHNAGIGVYWTPYFVKRGSKVKLVPRLDCLGRGSEGGGLPDNKNPEKILMRKLGIKPFYLDLPEKVVKLPAPLWCRNADYFCFLEEGEKMAAEYQNKIKIALK